MAGNVSSHNLLNLEKEEEGDVERGKEITGIKRTFSNSAGGSMEKKPRIQPPPPERIVTRGVSGAIKHRQGHSHDGIIGDYLTSPSSIPDSVKPFKTTPTGITTAFVSVPSPIPIFTPAPALVNIPNLKIPPANVVTINANPIKKSFQAQIAGKKPTTVDRGRYALLQWSIKLSNQPSLSGYLQGSNKVVCTKDWMVNLPAYHC